MSDLLANRIIVTGGRGRLASLIADHFQPAAGPLVLYSRRAGDGFHALDDLAHSANLDGAAVLLHLAWSTLPATSEAGAGVEWQHDLPNLGKILTALAAVPAARRPLFVFFSSGGTVYGSAPGRPSVEDDVCRPMSWYGRAKVAAEEIILRHAAASGLACAILRITNPYGYPVPKSRAQGIIPHAVRCAAEQQPLTLYGDGSARKDFLYYTDFLAALDLVVARRLTGTFNLAAGESHTLNEVFALVEQHGGLPVPLDHQPVRTWDVPDCRLDHRRFCAATGWRPHVSLDEGIRRSTAGFAAH